MPKTLAGEKVITKKSKIFDGKTYRYDSYKLLKSEVQKIKDKLEKEGWDVKFSQERRRTRKNPGKAGGYFTAKVWAIYKRRPDKRKKSKN